MMKRLVACAFVAVALVSGTRAEDYQTSPIELSFLDFMYHPIDVAGLRVGIPYGNNDSVTGIDVGLWGKSTYMYGIQFNLLANIVTDRAGAIQVAIFNDTKSLVGIQGGLWNSAGGLTGLQVGLLNLADEVEGFQIGLINRAELMHGFQVGIVNVIRSSPLPFCPLMNVGF
jgi:hypothetical protein